SIERSITMSGPTSEKKDFEPVVAAFRELLECFRCAGCRSWLYVTPRGIPEALRCPCNTMLSPATYDSALRCSYSSGFVRFIDSARAICALMTPRQRRQVLCGERTVTRPSS